MVLAQVAYSGFLTYNSSGLLAFLICMGEEKKIENQAKWWKPAITMFAHVSTWVVVPIGVSLFVGKFLDKRFGTSPWIFLGLTIVAFTVSILGIAYISSKYIKVLEKEIKEKKDGISK